MWEIDKQMILDLIIEAKRTDPETGSFTEWIAEYLAEHLSNLRPSNEWIDVKKKLPENERPVLTFVGYEDTMHGFITTSSYFLFDKNPHWQWDGLLRDEQRTLYWMPLPAPPDRRPPEGEVNETK